ncbi:hypothetical protein DF051_15900 [Burkholderia contaminans]|uniref:Uncharacterized protein n=1 Tax=Burkholderia contaminans TaxID=488447 RepID=A0A3N8PXA8_9BURK|nr:hypothetical protein DF051_15900 [Burkholderia contaminans]
MLYYIIIRHQPWNRLFPSISKPEIFTRSHRPIAIVAIRSFKRIARSHPTDCSKRRNSDDAIRPYDGVARVGGGAMMVLLRQAERDTARSVGERIRALERCASVHDARASPGVSGCSGIRTGCVSYRRW